MDSNSCLTRLCNGFVSYPNPYEKIKRGFYTYEAYCFIRGLERAGEGEHLDLIDFYISKGSNINDAMYGAARGGHFYLIEILIDRGAKDWDKGMYGALDGGHLHVLKFFLEKGAKNIVWAVYMAKKDKNSQMLKAIQELRPELKIYF